VCGNSTWEEKNRCASFGTKLKLNTGKKKSVRVIWRQAEMKHGRKKISVTFGAKRKLNTDPKIIGV
jgi:hypothetical protein